MAKAPTDIRSLARTHTATALRTLVQIAASKKANDSARVSAAAALLDRGWGKPKQTIDTNLNAGARFLDLVSLISTGSVGEGLVDESEQPPALRDARPEGNA